MKRSKFIEINLDYLDLSTVSRVSGLQTIERLRTHAEVPVLPDRVIYEIYTRDSMMVINEKDYSRDKFIEVLNKYHNDINEGRRI